MIERLAEKYANSVPNYQLVKYDYVAFPVYKVQLSITLLKKKEIGIVEEYILKLLDAGISNIDEIINILGLDKSIIVEAIANLNQQDLIFLVSGVIKISDKGLECLRVAKLIVPQEEKYHILIDGLTGELLPMKQLYTQNDVKKFGLHTLNKCIDEPLIENINFKELSRLIKIQNKEAIDDNTLDGDLISINQIEKCYTVYKKRSILVFINENDKETLDIKVFDGFDRIPQYESIILRMEHEGIRQIPTDRQQDLVVSEDKDSFYNIVPDEVLVSAKENKNTVNQYKVKTESLQNQIENREEVLEEEAYLSEEEKLTTTQELRQLKKQLSELQQKQESSNKLLETYNHRPLLEQSLKEAKKAVVIVSPWIKSDAFDGELQSLIIGALNRKVQVIIGYGITNYDAGNIAAERRLKEIQNKKYGKYLSLVKLGNTHEKVLLVDGKFVVITSFNWLSFKGDPNRGFRQETGIYTEDEKTIISTIDSLEQRMNINIRKYFE